MPRKFLRIVLILLSAKNQTIKYTLLMNYILPFTIIAQQICNNYHKITGI